MENKKTDAEKEAKSENKDVAINGKSAEGGLPHGPPAGMYDDHEKEVLDAKAADQLRVLKDRNKTNVPA